MEEIRNLLAGLSQEKKIGCISYKTLVERMLKTKKSRIWDKYILQGKKFLDSFKNCNILFLGEKNYPKFLFEINDPPKYIFYEGNLPNLNWERTISVVGTRRMSQYGSQCATIFGRFLAEMEIAVVSGFAYGVDKEIQLTMLKQNCPTIAVLAEGIDVWINKNRQIYDKYKSNLILISEYGPGSYAKNFNFPQRNRIIAGLTQKTVVIEAPSRSGALITANLANGYNREVYAIPHVVNSYNGQGCNRLIKNEIAKILINFQDVFQYSVKSSNTSFNTEGQISFTSDLLDHDELNYLNQVLKTGSVKADKLAIDSSKNLVNMLHKLTILERKGILNKSIDNKYSLKQE